MIYLKSSGEAPLTILILEKENLERIEEGKPLVTPDRRVIVTYTPDVVWLAQKLKDTDGDIKKVVSLIEESFKRERVPLEAQKDRKLETQEVKFKR